MTKLIGILLVALVFEAVGVVFLSIGLKQVGDLGQMSVSEIKRIVLSSVTNRFILCGVFFEALFFLGLLILMSRGDVSFVWPLTSLGFVLTTLAAKLFLHEEVTLARWTGVSLIMLGAALISWTEHNKAPKEDSLVLAGEQTLSEHSGDPPEG